MTTEEDYDRWREGRSTITECTQQTTRLLREEIATGSLPTIGERYAFALGSLTASVAAEASTAELFALIRSGSAS